MDEATLRGPMDHFKPPPGSWEDEEVHRGEAMSEADAARTEAALRGELIGIWGRHVEASPEDPTLWWNAVGWVSYVDNAAGLSLAQRGQALHPSPFWDRKIEFLQAMGETLAERGERGLP